MSDDLAAIATRYRHAYGLARIPEIFHDFRFRGGALSLHLIETVHEWEGVCLDRIEGPADWTAWLERARLAAPAAPADDTELAGMRELRLAVYLVARAIVDGAAIPDPAVRRINAAARGEGIPKALIRSGADLTVGHPRAVEHRHVLAEIARDAVSTLALPGAARLRECADPGCPTIFIDHSQAGRRRWCSPQCGARTATRAYRRRAAAAEDET